MLIERVGTPISDRDVGTLEDEAWSLSLSLLSSGRWSLSPLAGGLGVFVFVFTGEEGDETLKVRNTWRMPVSGFDSDGW